MRAVVYHGPHNVRVEEVAKPRILDPQDAIVKVTLTTLCGTDLHPYRGTMPGMQDGTVLGHEFVGVVEEVGSKVKNLKPGDRVLAPSTIACGYCSYCTSGLYADCENANPVTHGTAYYGGPKTAGGYQGGQAEYVRVPFASVNAIKIPDTLADEQAIPLTDIFPTGYFGADLGEVEAGNSVAVFGAGPVGLMAMESARLMDAGRIFAVDVVPGRLDVAARRGFEALNFAEGDPVQQIMDLTGGRGVDVAIDAVGVDARCPSGHHTANGHDDTTQALKWAAGTLKKAGNLSIVGAYPQSVNDFPLAELLDKGVTVRGGACNHRRYIPHLMAVVQDGTVDPTFVITHTMPLEQAETAYDLFDRDQDNHLKIVLETPPSRQAAG